MTVRSFLVILVLIVSSTPCSQAQVVRQLDGHRGAVYALAFHPDGEYLATASLDHTLKLWNLSTGEEVQTFTRHHSKVLALAFGPTGNRLASADLDGVVRLWETSPGPVSSQLEASPPREGGQEVSPYRQVREFFCRQCIHTLAFTPDGRRLICAGEDGRAEVWDTEQGNRLLVLPSLPCAIYSAAVSPHDNAIALAGLDHRIYLFDLVTGEQRQVLEGHYEAVYSVAFAPDGTLASGSGDRNVRLWDVTTCTARECLEGHHEAIYQVVFSRDGRRLVSAGLDGEVIVWNCRTGRPLHSHRFPSRTLCTAFTPDGRSLGAGTGQARCYLLELPRHVR